MLSFNLLSLFSLCKERIFVHQILMWVQKLVPLFSVKFLAENAPGRHLLSLVEGYNCTSAAIFEFPSDGFTREQRQHGWVVLHFVLACYGFVLLAIVCDDYFVPTIKRICDGN